MAGVELLFGPMLIGTLLNMMLYGVMFVQMVAYYQRYTNDSAWIRYFNQMLYLLIVQSANVVVQLGIIYDPLIIKNGQQVAIALSPKLLPGDSIIISIVAAPIQLFTAWRISVITGSFILPGIIGLLSLGSFGAGITVSSMLSMNPEFRNFGRFKPEIIIWLVLSAVCDIVIAIGMTHALSTRRTGFSTVDGQINRIVRLTVETGALTAITALVDVALFLAFPKTSINFSVDFFLSNLYTCSMLAMLNSRERQKPADVEHAHIVPQLLTHDQRDLKPRPSFRSAKKHGKRIQAQLVVYCIDKLEIHTSTEKMVTTDLSDAASERILASHPHHDYHKYKVSEVDVSITRESSDTGSTSDPEPDFYNYNDSHSSSDRDPPPLPTLTGDARIGTEDNSSREDLRRGMTLPGQPSGTMVPTIQHSHNQSTTLTTTVTVIALSTEEKMWKAANNPNADVSKSEKFLNKIVEEAGAAADTSTGVISTLKTIAANEEVQQIGKAILNGIPALMSALEGLSKAHPFAAAAFLPCQFAYKQVMQQHDNEKSRISLFESIKDVILVTVEMKGVGITADDQRRMPDGQPVVTRLAALGKQMERTLRRATTDRMIDAFFKANGGEEAVMADDAKCAALKKLQSDLTVTHNIQSTDAGSQDPGRAEHKGDILALRKEYRADVASVIEENMESFAKRMDLSLHLLGEDLKNDIHREGDRFINFLKGGPYLRLKDKIMRQGWRGSAKTRSLVLALRDYLVERAEHAESGLLPAVTASPSVAEGDDAQDPETAVGVPLPDEWMLEYLQVKRLRNLQQVFDPDTSDFCTIAEVNTFTESRQAGWSLPRWISYWAIGWQIYATRYCTEIDEIFTQMLLLRDQVAVQMPGNKRYINNYLSDTWPVVVGLTSGIERFEGTDWLADQFREYVDAQETSFRSSLERIHYDIDSSDTLSLGVSRTYAILGKLSCIFMLIAIILRRHLAKMHLCMTAEMNDEELFDDSYTVKFVVKAAWLRYNDLLEFYKHQQIIDMKQNFECFSCGLFRNYFAWNDWTSEKHYKTTEIISYSAVSAISEIKFEDLHGILIHDVDPILNIDSDQGTKTIDDSKPADISLSVRGRSSLQPPGLGNGSKTTQGENTSNAVQNIASSLSEIQDILSGVWFGFRATEEGLPYTGMFHLKFRASTHPGRNELIIEGEGSSFRSTPDIGTIEGTATPIGDGQSKLEFRQQLTNEEYSYRATLALDLQIISGACEGVDSDKYEDGTFILKKTPVNSIMCHRPLFPRRLTTRELWSFAYDAVVGALHRRKPSLKYFHTGMKMIKRCLELLHSSDRLGEPTELSRLRKAFTVQEYVEVRRLASWYNRVNDLQPTLYCDCCDGLITRSRVLCLQCESTDSPSMVEFDADEDCISCSTLESRDDLATPHLPTHPLLKTRDMLFLMDYPSVKSKAMNCITLATRLYSDAKTVVPQTVGIDGGVLVEQADASSVTVTVSATINADSTHPSLLSSLPAPTPETPRFNANIAISEQPSPAARTVVKFEAEAHNSGSESDSTDSDDSNSSSDSDDREDEIITLNCLVCHQQVSTPCWYCIDCKQQDAFVCSACETAIEELFPWEYLSRYRKEVGYRKKPGLRKETLATVNSSAHNVLHLLVRVGNAEGKSPVEGPETDDSQSLSLDRRDIALREVEQRLLQRMDGDKRQLQEQVAAVEQRLARIEALLQALLPMATKNILDDSEQA
ncbi:hypothetical protein B0H19DRAFT_1247319 [Mycena capillaripes]|nr:hypothetical protein B0H19DRAFT_1247319 [Mycena capillaripes]